MVRGMVRGMVGGNCRFVSPKGFRRIAQGCRAAATLGDVVASFCQPRRGCVIAAPAPTKPRWGLRRLSPAEPRVAAARQPWAGLQKPFGLAQQRRHHTAQSAHWRENGKKTNIVCRRNLSTLLIATRTGRFRSTQDTVPGRFFYFFPSLRNFITASLNTWHSAAIATYSVQTMPMEIAT